LGLTNYPLAGAEVGSLGFFMDKNRFRNKKIFQIQKGFALQDSGFVCVVKSNKSIGNSTPEFQVVELCIRGSFALQALLTGRTARKY